MEAAVPQNANQARAAQAVAAWLAHHEKNPAWLVDMTGADPGTIGDFLNGHRWPKLGTQGKIEKALGWPPGSIRQIGLGYPPEQVGAVVSPARDLAAEVRTSNLSPATREYILEVLKAREEEMKQAADETAV
jgi:hypothetical protein